ncbi:MAG: Wzz/FepE/Etk N-terminal domain-containing protein, partial [Pyrinomonadaceae bacterium]
MLDKRNKKLTNDNNESKLPAKALSRHLIDAQPLSNRYIIEVNDESVDIERLWRALWKRKGFLLFVTLIGAMLGAVIAFNIRSTYMAETVVEVNREQTGIIKNIEPEPQSEQMFNMDLTTKMLKIKSRPIIEDTIIGLKLDQNPAFHAGVNQGLSVTGIVKGFLRRFKSPSPQPISPPTVSQATVSQGAEHNDIQKGDIKLSFDDQNTTPQVRAPDALVKMVEDNLRVEQVRDTRAVRISFTHADPLLAANITNSMAQNFIKREFEGKTERYTNTAHWLDRST